MSLYKVSKGVTLYTQGLPGNYWYIVQSGELSVFSNSFKFLFSSNVFFSSSPPIFYLILIYYSIINY